MRNHHALMMLLLFSTLFAACNSKEHKEVYSCYEDIIYSIDTDSIEGISAIWRQINLLDITYRYSAGESLSFYLQKKWNKLYLLYEKEKIRLDKYDKFSFKPEFDSLGFDIAKVKYTYDLMSKYPIRRIRKPPDYLVSMVDFDSVSYFYVRDTAYLQIPYSKERLKRLDEHWWVTTNDPN